MSSRKTEIALGLAGAIALSASMPSMASMPTAVAAIKTAPQPISSMCAGAGGRGSVSALDWAFLEQRSRRRITTVTVILITTAIRMVTPATTGTRTPTATTATPTGTMRGRTGHGGTMDGVGGTMGPTTSDG